MAKRLFDFVLAGVGLVVLLPLFLLIALAIKLADGGPVFYRQQRIGKGGAPFQILKFRSMRVNADRMGPSITQRGDPRVTGVGRIIRKTKVDELPQLWNVLVGEMSFVGPRPEVPRYVALYTAEQRQILALKPGITDEASIEFRDEEALLAQAADPESFYVNICIPKKISLNLRHASQATLASDLKVIARTVGHVWLGKK